MRPLIFWPGFSKQLPATVGGKTRYFAERFPPTDLPMRFTYLAFLLLLCTGGRAQTTVSYDASPEDFPNPERGFYHYTETRSESYNPLDASDLAALRGSNTSGGANHSVVSSLIFRYFFLRDFRNGAISQAYLDAMTADFAAVRAAGLKIIPRFAYTDEVNGDGCSSFICPPYGDASKATVLTHIAQIGPLLRANADVIATVQMGFIGTWGENYYTDFFGDASQQGRLLDENWQDRFEVLNALLAEVPANRSVQVRYPQMKQRTVYGVNAPTTSAPLTAAEAFSGTDKARIGFHNDCLLASFTDYGTYENYGNSSAFGGSDTTNLKPYFAADSRYVPVGGETCDDSNYDPENNCTSAGGFGDAEMKRMHYSYLNVDFNHDVNNDWQTGGCMDAIKRQLGYRFELQSGSYPDQIVRGGGATFSFTLKNLGYAAPYNERRVELLLRNVATGEVWLAPLAADPRTWDRENAQHQITEQLCAPAGMPTGTYDLLLNLPAPEASIYQRPEYSIRLANRLGGAEVWEAATGYNDLGQQVEITSSGGTACGGGTEFLSLFATLPVDFLAITAQPVEKRIAVRWSTANESDNRHFVVERGVDGQAFTSIGTVTPRTDGSYLFDDENVAANQPYHYRIRQVDFAGSFTFSPVVSAVVRAKEFLIAYPNPTTGILTLNQREGDLRVINQTGQVVSAPRNAALLDLTGLPAGVYHLELELANEVLRTKVVLR